MIKILDKTNNSSFYFIQLFLNDKKMKFNYKELTNKCISLGKSNKNIHFMIVYLKYR